VEHVHVAADQGAREALSALAATVAEPIGAIAIRVCPALPPTIEGRIIDARAAAMADSIMYRQALAKAASVRGWRAVWYDRDTVLAQAAALVGEDIDAFLTAIGRSLGPPWQARHKLAATAAILAAMGSDS